MSKKENLSDYEKNILRIIQKISGENSIKRFSKSEFKDYFGKNAKRLLDNDYVYIKEQFIYLTEKGIISLDENPLPKYIEIL